MQPVERTFEGRSRKAPDLFLCHSSRDKDVVRELAEYLSFCEVDVWLDEWEIQPGNSLHDSITQALEKSRFIGVSLVDHFDDSRYADDEMKQALARERRSDRAIVLPLVFGQSEVPPFLEDKLYLDFRDDYFHALSRLAALIHEIPKQHIEEAILATRPQDIRSTIDALRFAGKEPYVIMSTEDREAILAAGGHEYIEDRVRFSPEQIANSPSVSPRLRRKMERLINEVW